MLKSRLQNTKTAWKQAVNVIRVVFGLGWVDVTLSAIFLAAAVYLITK